MGAVRLRNITTGVVVSVAEEKAERMGAQWEPADEAKKTPAKKTASSKSTEK